MCYFVLLIISLLATHSLIFMGLFVNGNMDTPEFTKKKIIDILVAISHYIVISALYGLVKNNFYSERIIEFIKIVCVISSAMNLYTFISQLPLFVRNLRAVHTKNGRFMVISVLTGMFLSMAEIYFLLFMLNENWFIVDTAISNSVLKTAFEFVYYTFSVTITYGGNGIEIVGIVPKIVQMAHILFFYLFAADAILQLIKKEE